MEAALGIACLDDRLLLLSYRLLSDWVGDIGFDLPDKEGSELAEALLGDDSLVTYAVSLAETRCNYGGTRPWFLCPADGCSRRVRKLYLGNRYFACRHCYRLRYASQTEHRRERLERRRYKLIRRIGGDGESWPERPHGMHRSTYDALLERLSTIEMAIDDEIYEGMLHARGLLGQLWRGYDEAVEKVAAEFDDLDEAEEPEPEELELPDESDIELATPDARQTGGPGGT